MRRFLNQFSVLVAPPSGGIRSENRAGAAPSRTHAVEGRCHSQQRVPEGGTRPPGAVWPRPPDETRPEVAFHLEPTAWIRLRSARRVSFAWLCVVALIFLLGTIPAEAAKAPNPDKPEKPDKIEKPDKLLKIDKAKPSKMPKSERFGQTKSERSEKSAAGDPMSPASSVPAGSLEAFRLIVDRNIFNPNRVGRTRASEEPPPRIEIIALVGTMRNEDGRLLAFFDSPDVAYQKAVDEGETIGELTVKRITANAVQLARGDKPFSVRVNQQLRRVADGEWRVVPRDYVRVETIVPVETAPAPTIPSDASAVLRRLMEQRQKQLRQ